MSKTDLLWSLATFVAISVLSVVLIAFMTWLGGVTQLFTYSSMPSNTGFRVLQPNEYWIFAPHALYLFFNIFGEEFLWRGIMLPRQELTHGKYAWMVNGSIWALLHLILVGLPVITMLPLLYMVPLVVQLRKNTWTGIIVHTLLAGPGFYLTALGIIKL